MMTTPPSEVGLVRALRELGQLEDEADARGWAWDAALSHRVDALRVLIEARRA
jgi:hypothetical protein